MFIQKLDLIQQQLTLKKVVHFTTLSTRPAESINHNKYFVLLGSLADEFKQRFADFRKHSKELKLSADPFVICAIDADDVYQLEVIEIQSDSGLKRAFADHDLLTFYSRYVPSQTYPNLSRHALQFISLFGSTYCYEQLFSRMKNIKTKSRSLLTDGHLSGILCIATSSVRADIDYLCKQKQCQISH